MRDVTLTDLSAPIRDFLIAARQGRGTLIRDEEGRAVLRIVPCPETSAEERERALRDLRRVQSRIGERLRGLGVTEEDFDRVAREGD